MRFRDLPRAAQAYVSAVGALAAAITLLALHVQQHAALELAALITIAAVVAHSFPVSTPGKHAYHVSLPFFVAAIVLLSPAQALLCIVAVHLAELWRRRTSISAQLFNVTSYALASLGAQAAYHALWQGPLDLAQPLCLVAGVAATVVFAVTNRVLVSLAIWLGNGVPPREQQIFDLESLLTDAVLLVMGLPLAQMAALAPWAAAATAAPLWLIHRVLDLPNVRAQSRQDALTKLFSEPYLVETCTRELNRARRFGRSVVLLLLDVDGLGELNAARGTQAGDAVIRGTAAVIRKATREYDLAARLAGGMFAVLLPETNLAQAQVVAERIRRQVAERRHELQGSMEPVRVTVSIGAVVVSGQEISAPELFKAAEVTLAQAKRVGGNRSEFAELPQVQARADASELDDEATPRPTRTDAIKRWLQWLHSGRALAAAALTLAAAVGIWAAVSNPTVLDWPAFGVLLTLMVIIERRRGEGLEHIAMQAAVFVFAAAIAVSTLGRFPLLAVVALSVPAIVMRHLSRQAVQRAVENVRKLRSLNEQLEHQAFHDPLTKLANRALFSERLEHALRRAEQDTVAVLFLDLDNFKTVNDTLGHAAGDALLSIVTQRLRQCVRWEDTIARLGGDEFTVLLENVRDVSQVARSADRIADALRQPFVLDGHEVNVSASIGIALDTDRSHAPDDLMREADLAMYRAKAGGKARYEIFDPEMGNDVLQRLDLETELRQTLDRGGLQLLVTDCDSHLVAEPGWHHPRRGLLQAEDFMSLTEDTDLRGGVTRWLLREACREAMRCGFATVEVAVALDDEIADAVADALRETGLPARNLRVRVSDGNVNVALLAALVETGVELAFGAAPRMFEQTQLAAA
jgi:diguanylate cyclase (GGDEF)-like protein